MELLCALLAAFFLWLFLLHWHRSALARAREVAGRLLIEVKPGPRERRTARVVRVMLALQMLVPCAIVGVMSDVLVRLSGDTRMLFADISWDFMVGFAFFFVLQASLPSFSLDRAQNCESTASCFPHRSQF